MSTATPTAPSARWTPAPRRPRRPRPRWRDARRALRALLADPDDTQRAVDVVHALDPGAVERNLARFLATPTGRHLYDARSPLAEALAPRPPARPASGLPGPRLPRPPGALAARRGGAPRGEHRARRGEPR